jgi:hypothetical protein
MLSKALFGDCVRLYPTVAERQQGPRSWRPPSSQSAFLWTRSISKSLWPRGTEPPLRYCHMSPLHPWHSSVIVSFALPPFLRSSAVPDYRAYIISLEGHFLGAEILSECADDEAAEKAAQKLTSNHNVELWDRDRLVIRFLSEK